MDDYLRQSSSSTIPVDPLEPSVATRPSAATSTPSRSLTEHAFFRSHAVAPSPPLVRSPPASAAARCSPHTAILPQNNFKTDVAASLSSLDPFPINATTVDAMAASPAPGLSPDLNPPSSTWTARAQGVLRQPLRLQTDIQPAVGLLAASPPLKPPEEGVGAMASTRNPISPSPPSAGTLATTSVSAYIRPSASVLKQKASSASLTPQTVVSRTPSLKTPGGSGRFGTTSAASSTVPSPIITALGNVTPLPSPLLCSTSPGPWKKLGRSLSPPSSHTSPHEQPHFALTAGSRPESAMTHSAKSKAYAELLISSPGHSSAQSLPPPPTAYAPRHTRERSLSEYTPNPLQLPKRVVTVSGKHKNATADGCDYRYERRDRRSEVGGATPGYEPQMRREPNLAQARGLEPTGKPPTPPPSESSMSLLHENSPDGAAVLAGDQTGIGETGASQTEVEGVCFDSVEYFEARDRETQKWRRWRSVKLLGQGTFSRVMLATNQLVPSAGEIGDASSREGRLPPTSTLVAVKICEHGPKGGASEGRVEMSLKRELAIMQSIDHPSLARLKAWSIEPTRAILVLGYCPGGDLFDIASVHRDLLSPRLLARIFSELIGAVQYLHGQHIVHRDIKLENVLVNLTPQQLADRSIDWRTYPYSVTTLADLGLARRVTDDERLETRCGSDDYAAPELIMGQPYDGRATDAWSLGVLLYALLESRLPFDPNPGMSDAHRMRSRTSHRIARVEWRWIRFAGSDGDHEGDSALFRTRGLEGAMEITEGLLKRARSRWTLNRVAETAWVCGAMTLDGGLQFRTEAGDVEID